MAYVIKRTNYPHGRVATAYLARGHGEHRWTNSIEKVRLFASYEAASRERCPENERIVELPEEC